MIGIIGTVGVIISGWGVSGRAPYSLGFVNIIAFVLMTPVLVFISPHGVAMANRLPRVTLQWLYAGFLLLVAVYMTYLVFQAY